MSIIISTIEDRESIARHLNDFAREVHAHDKVMWRTMCEASDHIINANKQISAILKAGNKLYDLLSEAIVEMDGPNDVMFVRAISRALSDWETETDMDTYGQS